MTPGGPLREPSRSDRRAAGLRLALVLLLLGLGLAVAIDLTPWREQVARRSLDAGAFGSRDMTRILSALGALHPRPSLRAPGESFEPPDLDPAYSLDPLPVEQITATFGIDPERVASGVPSVALLVAPDDLAELEANPEERGRAWERPAYFAFVEAGRVLDASLVGVRIHGGGGRRKGRYGFRLYFRRRYGDPWLAAEVLDTGGMRPPKRVVLRRDGGRGRGRQPWHFVNAIGHDIARRIGLAAAHSRPVAFYLNGRYRGVVALVERIDRHYLLAHYGHDDFVQVDTKFSRFDPTPQVKLGDEQQYGALVAWATAREPLSLDEVRRRVDLENFVRWGWLMQILATGDFRQGALLLDRSDPKARWFTIPWDLDISLGIWGGRSDLAAVNRFPDWLIPRLWRRDVRTAVVGSLLTDSDSFRTLYTTELDEILNHRLTDEWIGALVDGYRQEAQRFGIDDAFLDFVHRFLRRRPDVLRQQLHEHLDFGPSHEVRVVAPQGVRIRVGGRLYERPFHGRYVEGSLLRLEIDPAVRHLFGAWLYSRREIAEPGVEIPVDGPLEVRLLTDRSIERGEAT